MTSLTAGACLSLTGRFAPFGQQAADGLRMWADECGADLTVLDDESDPEVLTGRLPGLVEQVDLLFGPYSTVLMRAAVPIVEQARRLLFNHGGSGSDPGPPSIVVDVLTPASRYALPFVAVLADSEPAPLYTAVRHGAFGRNVITGAAEAGRRGGIEACALDLDDPPSGTWDLLSAGVYEDDVATVRVARSVTNPPRLLCSVAAGVARFADNVGDPEGIYGVGQWAPGATGGTVDAGLDEQAFLSAWNARYGGVPEYPGVQAYATGVIAQRCAETAGATETDTLWQVAARLDLRTVFGQFRLNPETGEQVGHEAVLTRWRGGVQVAVQPTVTAP